MKVETYGKPVSSDALKPGDCFATWLSKETHYCIAASWKDSNKRFYVVLSASEKSEIKAPTQVEFGSAEPVLSFPAAIIRPRFDIRPAQFASPAQLGSLVIEGDGAYIVCAAGMRASTVNLATGQLGSVILGATSVIIPAWEIIVPTPEVGGYQVLFSSGVN